MIKPMPQRPFAGTFSALWKRSLELIAPAAAELGVGGAFAGGGHGNRHAGGIPAGAGWIGQRIVGMHRCSLDSRCPELGFAADGTRCRATPNTHSKATICNKFQAILIRIGTISTSCIYTPLTVDIDPPTIRTTSRIGQKNEGNMVSGMRQAQERDPQRANQYSVALELQADCFAGAWASDVSARGLFDQPNEVEEALDAAAAVGDDAIQEQTTGRVDPESWTHGSSAQRVEWFQRGFQTGDPQQCTTFSEVL